METRRVELALKGRLSAMAAIGMMLCGVHGRRAASLESQVRADGPEIAAETLAGETHGFASFDAPGPRKSALTARQAGRRRTRNAIASASRRRNRA